MVLMIDQRQSRAETSEEVDIRQGQNALGSLSLSTGLTPSHNRAATIARSAIVARTHNNRLLEVTHYLSNSAIFYDTE